MSLTSHLDGSDISRAPSRLRQRRASNVTTTTTMSVPRVRKKKGLWRFCPEICDQPSLKTEKGRSVQMLQLIILPIIPVLVLGINSIYRLGNAVNTMVKFDHILDSMEHVLTLDKLISNLQMERGMNAYLLGNNGTSMDLLRQYRTVDQYLASLSIWPSPSEQQVLNIDSKESVTSSIRQYRLTLENDSVVEELAFYTNLTRSLIHWTSTILWTEQQTDLWAQGVAYYYLLRAQDNIGLLRALGALYFSSGQLESEAHNQFLASTEDSQAFINISMQHDANILDSLNEKFYLTDRAGVLESWGELVLDNERMAPSPATGTSWFVNVTSLISDIATVREDTIQFISRGMNMERQMAYDELILDIVGLIVSLAFGPLVFLVMRKLTNSIADGVNDILYKQSQAKFEKRKTEELLYQMLPKQVALQLRMHNKVNAETFDEVTVMFSDIKNFTDISNLSTPFQIVNFLNAIYNHIDSSLEKYDVYKVETISDVYMVVSGCPLPNEDRHVVEIANLSIDLIENTKSFRVPHLRQETLHLRIGMNSGSCVAGVVGEKMPRYCLFGDTINTAARMQTNGLPLKIHLSPTSQDLLDRLGGYIIQYRGVMTIKGKGEMKTYWLAGKELDINHSNSNSLRVGFIT